ncbi:MAG: hypothetical protein JSU74_04770, partial [Candidatus Zixiibacteriota bacterium]
LDADSIEMWEYRGEVYYHALLLSRRVMTFIATYRYTGEARYLERAEKYTQFLMDRCHIIDSGAYSPIYVNYCVHGAEEYFLPAPWYSGMHQGEFLMAICRVFEVTGKECYGEFARSLFRSLTRIRSLEHNVSVLRQDSLGYFWIEEYPHPEHPGMTLNGYIQAVFGLYEYLRVMDNNQGQRVWDACLSSLKYYIPQFRREGGRSYYCLGHKRIAGPSYHKMHIGQFRLLAKLSGDEFFNEWADIFESDYPS